VDEFAAHSENLLSKESTYLGVGAALSKEKSGFDTIFCDQDFFVRMPSLPCCREQRTHLVFWKTLLKNSSFACGMRFTDRGLYRMKLKRLTANGEKVWALIMEIGDEPMTELEKFAREHQVASAHFVAIGAFERVTLAYFDWQQKEYQEIPLDEQVEVLTMAGDIALKDGKPKIHAHLVVGRSDGTTRGGHLKEARVRPTLEVMLSESPGHLRRRFDPVSGLALIDPEV